MNWNNITNVSDGVRYKTLFPNNDIYTKNSLNESVIDATEDFNVYYENLLNSYTVTLQRIGTDGSGSFAFYISSDGVNFTAMKASDGTTDLVVNYSSADSDNVVFFNADKAYIKITHTNTDNTEGNIIIKLKDS